MNGQTAAAAPMAPNATVVSNKGREITFFDSGMAWDLTGTLTVSFQLIQSGADFIFYDPRTGRLYTFDSAGLLTRVEDANGNKIEMAAAGITVKAMKIVVDGSQLLLAGEGGEPLIKAQTFMSMYNSHTHVCTTLGAPSTPPVPPLTPAAMTTKTKAN